MEACCKQASKVCQRAADEGLIASNQPGIEENHGFACGFYTDVVLDASVFESSLNYPFVHLSAYCTHNVFCSGTQSWQILTQAGQLPAKKSPGDGRTIPLHGMHPLALQSLSCRFSYCPLRIMSWTHGNCANHPGQICPQRPLPGLRPLQQCGFATSPETTT